MLPPLAHTAPTSGSRRGPLSYGAGRKPARSLAPRIQQLADILDFSADGEKKSALCELALLASRSTAACHAVASARLERQLIKLLAGTDDTMMQVWAMSVLANTASDPASRERQGGAERRVG